MHDELRSLVDAALSGDQNAAADLAMVLDEFSVPAGMADKYAGEPLVASLRNVISASAIAEIVGVLATELTTGNVPNTAASTLVYALGCVQSGASVAALERIALTLHVLDEEAQFQLVCALEHVAYLDRDDPLARTASEVAHDRRLTEQLEQLARTGSERVRLVAGRILERVDR